MGTRGSLGFIAEGNAKFTYNHYDSYPDGLGLDVLRWLRETVANDGETESRVQVTLMSPVEEDASPTPGELEFFSEFHDPRVSRGDDWYALLRDTQGNPAKILRARYYVDASEFPLDSLFCEFAYVVDFDARVLEAYEGFQRTSPTRGRWVGFQANDGGYYPSAWRAAWSFDELPTDDEFITALSPADEED